MGSGIDHLLDGRIGADLAGEVTEQGQGCRGRMCDAAESGEAADRTGDSAVGDPGAGPVQLTS